MADPYVEIIKIQLISNEVEAEQAEKAEEAEEAEEAEAAAHHRRMWRRFNTGKKNPNEIKAEYKGSKIHSSLFGNEQRMTGGQFVRLNGAQWARNVCIRSFLSMR